MTLKTQMTDASCEKFLNGIKDEAQRKDTRVIFDMMKQATKQEPRMWGAVTIGFGSYHYVGKSGREGDWYLVGVAPRKQAITLYALGGWDHDKGLLSKLGKHSLGMGCMYIKRLSDVDVAVLKKLIVASVRNAIKLDKSGATILK